MSVINQMLRDLDARQASSQERAGLPPRLRALPPERRFSLPPWGLLVIGLMLGAAMVWLLTAEFLSPAGTQKHAPVPSQSSMASPQAAAERPPTASEAAAPLRLPSPDTTVVPPAPAPQAMAAQPKATLPRAAERPQATASPPAPPALEPGNSTRPQGAPQQAAAPLPTVAEPVADLPAEGGEPTGRIEKQPKGTEKNDLAESEYRKGAQAASQGEHATALPALRRALEIDPRHAKARQALLAVLANQRQWDEVKRVAREGIALDPARTVWATLLARLEYEEGDLDGALKTLEGHVAQAASDAEFHALYAFLLQKRQRSVEAVEHYQTALRLRPSEGRWWFGLGLALETAGRGEEARAAFVKAREAGSLPAEMRSSIEEKLAPLPRSASASARE